MNTSDGMLLVVIYAGVFSVCAGLGWLWMMYLIKVVLNEEEMQEQIRAQRRLHEELMRMDQEKARRDHQRTERLRATLLRPPGSVY